MADAISIQELIDARTDAKTLEEAVNGDAVTTVLSRLGETYPTLSNALNQIDSKLDSADAQIKQAITDLFQNGGLPATPFATKALMTASALVDGDYAMVTDDTVNNGLYVKTAGAWVKSAYDPVAQANSYTDLTKQAVIDDADTENIINEIDANGQSVRRIDRDGKHWFIGIEKDLSTSLKDLDTSLKDLSTELKDLEVPDVSDIIELSDTSDTDIFNIKDANGAVTAKQTNDGHFHTSVIGDITQTLLDLKLGSSSKELNLQSAHLAGKYADYAVAQNTPKFSQIDYILTKEMVNDLGVFSHPVGSLRIPAITRIGRTKYLLHFEARADYHDDYGNISIGVTTVNIDPDTFEITLSNTQSLHESFTDSEGKLRTFMQGVSVKLDSGKIICLYLRRYQKTEHDLYMRTSVDDGVTWSEYTDLSSIKNALGLNVFAPNSQGLVKRYGQHKGRIVFPIWTTGKVYTLADYHSGYVYSDDEGVTWHVGEFAPYPSGNECQIAEDLNGDMLFSIRLETYNPPKLLVRHSDKTKEYTVITPNKSLTDETIMGGLIQGENQYDLSANKFHMTTCRTPERRELLIHTSYDGGETWRSLLLPETVGKAVAYTSIESISASHKFIVWESDNMNQLKYAVIALTNLIDGEL